MRNQQYAENTYGKQEVLHQQSARSPLKRRWGNAPLPRPGCQHAENGAWDAEHRPAWPGKNNADALRQSNSKHLLAPGDSINAQKQENLSERADDGCAAFFQSADDIAA